MKLIKSCGFTEIFQNTKETDTFTIYHGGNMGNDIENSVNPNLKIISWPTVDEIKNSKDEFEVISESGSPSYMYKLKYRYKKMETKLHILRSTSYVFAASPHGVASRPHLCFCDLVGHVDQLADQLASCR